jgi:hypothetical protein
MHTWLKIDGTGRNASGGGNPVEKHAVERHPFDAEKICGDDNRRRISIRNSERVRLKRIEDPRCPPLLEIARNGRAQRRRYIHSRKTCLESVHLSSAFIGQSFLISYVPVL